MIEGEGDTAFRDLKQAAGGVREPVSQSKDGHPSGRHMIEAFRMMAVAARTSGGKHQKDIAEVYDCAALCIENEARRADRAESLLVKVAPTRTPQVAVQVPGRTT